jgi:hypothetical protein
MTQEDRVRAMVDVGFTERQARFLVLVLRHAGVCIPRQYASFAGIANGGRRCNAFFAKLVRRRYATVNECVHNRARLYHVHHRPLYSIMGEATSRYRRRVSPRLAVERLMVLDAVLTTPSLEWLTTAAEKAVYLAKLSANARTESANGQPAERLAEAAPALPSPCPIGVEPDGRAVLLYLATEPWPDGFRSFLQRHARLLRMVPTWTLRLVFPRPVDRAYDGYQMVIREELESPLHSATIGELKCYFEHRLKAPREPILPLTQGFLDVDGEVFGTPRFTEMYQRWLKHGNAVFEGPSTPMIAEALSTGRGHVESIVLPHSYRHLLPLVDEAAAPPQPIERGLRRGNARGNMRPHVLNPRPQPPPVETPLRISEQLAREWRELNEFYKAQKALKVRP